MSRHGRSRDRRVAEAPTATLRCTGAGEGNRTLVVGLGSLCSTIELHPQRGHCTAVIMGVRVGPARREPAQSRHSNAPKRAARPRTRHAHVRRRSANAGRHNSRRRGSAPCAPNTDAARCAPSPCCTWTTRPTPASSGRPGTGASARRWPTRPSPRPAVGRRSTASSTPTAHDVTQASDRTTPTSTCTMPDRPRGLLEPCAGTTGSHGS